jgi:hypothetical protein
MLTTLLEWLGAGMAILGAAILATNSDISGLGFVAFLVSNVFLMLFAYRIQRWGLLLMQLVFTATSVAGIVNWL